MGKKYASECRELLLFHGSVLFGAYPREERSLKNEYGICLYLHFESLKMKIAHDPFCNFVVAINWINAYLILRCCDLKVITTA